MSDQHFRIKILGPPVLSWYDQSYKLSRRQARGLLFLLANSPQPVARERLCFLLWPDIPESRARRNLSRLLSYLRAQLPEPDHLLVNTETIRLNQEKVWSDALEFSQLSARRAPEAKQAAIELYRGSFLQGFSLPKCIEYERWMSDQESEYERLFLTILADLIKSKSEVHDLASAIHYAQTYLSIDELAEEIHRQLISLYAANGEQAAAMRQFEACTFILERELGVEPLPETRATFEAARSHLIAPPPQMKPPPIWTVLPSLELPLVGRRNAWAALEEAYRRFQRGGLIFIRGEPGIGKSRLLQEFATSQDRLVLSGNCHASTQTLPYEPITQALRQVLTQLPLWQGIRPIWLSESSRLLPELNDHFPNLPRSIEVEPEQAQARMYEALTQCILGIAANTPVLLCLDDLQWADEATLGWLGHLSKRITDSGLCVMAAYRTGGASAVTGLRETFTRMDLSAEVPLDGLSMEAIHSILEQLPQPPPQPGVLVTRIKNATGGNPFFVLETLRAMLESDQLAAPPQALPLAGTVQETILGRLDKISPVSRQVLEAAAVLAPDLDQPLLQETAGRADFELADALDELVRRQMLTEGEPPRLRHDLLAQVTYQNLSPWRRRLLHHRAAGALAELHPGEVDEAARVARHYDAAGEYKRAVDSFLLAATAARERYAQDEAIGYLERALELSKELSLSPQRLAKIYARLGESLVARGEFEAARQAYQYCLAHMPTEEIIQRAEVQRKLAMTFLSQRRLGEAETAFEDALATLGPGPGGKSAAWQVAWLDIQLARLELLYFQYKLEQLDEILQRIEPILEEIGTPKHYDAFYGGQSRLLAQQERFSLAKKSIRIAEKMLRAAQETDEPATLAYAKFGLGFSLLWSGDLDAAAGSMEDSLALAEEFGVAMTQCLSLAYLGYCYRLQGDVARVRTIARRSLENAQHLDIPAYVGAAQAHLAWVDWRENKLVAAERGARKALALWAEFLHPFQWNAHWVLCAVYLERGQLAAAVESARVMLHPNQARLPDDVTAALECVVGNWDAGEQADAQEALDKAVEIAQKQGYL